MGAAAVDVTLPGRAQQVGTRHLINGIIDILEGHTVTGTSRLIQATLLVICIATGLAVPLLLFMKNLL